jgi:hypothetical protein
VFGIEFSRPGEQAAGEHRGQAGRGSGLRLRRRGGSADGVDLAQQPRAGLAPADQQRRADRVDQGGAELPVDSDHYGQFHYQDTRLISPALNFTSDKTPVVSFATDLVGAVNSTATVDVSTDNGRTWANVWTNKGAAGDPGRATVVVPLPQAAGKSGVQVDGGVPVRVL